MRLNEPLKDSLIFLLTMVGHRHYSLNMNSESNKAMNTEDCNELDSLLMEREDLRRRQALETKSLPIGKMCTTAALKAKVSMQRKHMAEVAPLNKRIMSLMES